MNVIFGIIILRRRNDGISVLAHRIIRQCMYKNTFSWTFLELSKIERREIHCFFFLSFFLICNLSVTPIVVDAICVRVSCVRICGFVLFFLLVLFSSTLMSNILMTTKHLNCEHSDTQENQMRNTYCVEDFLVEGYKNSSVQHFLDDFSADSSSFACALCSWLICTNQMCSCIWYYTKY